MKRLTNCCLPLIVTLSLWGCAETTPTGGKLASPPPCEPLKADFLWVIDNSASMCDDQVTLARAGGLNAFVSQLGIDARMAVTTVDMHCDPELEGITTSRGVFTTEFGEFCPPWLYTHLYAECVADSDCDTVTGEPGKWWCDPEYSERCTVNPNGSVNSKCYKTCTDDTDCIAYHGDDGYICASAFGLPPGCIRHPPVSDCPPQLPPVLDNATLDLFPCSASVGVNQSNCFKYEQGLQAAWSALDRSEGGPNVEQAKAFLRDDAFLVLLFVTNDDECSVPPDQPDAIPVDNFVNCSEVLEDSDHGGPLVPVREFVDRYQSLKADPDMVFVAVIAGDAPGQTPPIMPTPNLQECRELAKQQCQDLDLPECRALDPPARDACVDAAEDACEEEVKAGCAQQVTRDFLCEDPASPDCDPAAVTDRDKIREWERYLFVLARSDPRLCHQSAYLCASELGYVDWGRRYLELVEGFGERGLFANLCSPDPMGSALESIAASLGQWMGAYCGDDG